jgi:hypothetical protein
VNGSGTFGVNCKKCDGDGQIACNTCHGCKEQFDGPCWACSGSGWFRCELCEGHGRRLSSNFASAFVCLSCEEWVSRASDYDVVQSFLDEHADCTAQLPQLPKVRRSA